MKEETPDEKTAIQGEMLRNRIKKRYRHLRKWARRIGTDVFRLYDRDIPEIPLVLDFYGDAVSGALYRRPYDKEAEEEDRWLEVMEGAVAEALEIDRDRVFLKRRERQRGKAQYRQLGNRGFEREVHEGDLRFRVNLSDYLDTGFFPDRRRMRGMVRAEAAGKRILNLFCYTAAFSVSAACGGAAEVDSVDMSRTYLEWAAENFALNRLTAQRVPEGLLIARRGHGGLSPLRLIQAEVRTFLEEARRARLRWDAVILDPPAFSNSKRMKGVLDIQRDYRPLIAQCLSLLNPGGKLWFSVTARHFRLDAEEFPGWEVRDLSALMEDEDFRGKRLPGCFSFTRPG
ncbi:MAG: class I SAM-dependent methyltransferase [Spirochaetaceae bacterium]|nr:class I SAM-dependent methyltransferase [Spirochaetaceae bacterium]